MAKGNLLKYLAKDVATKATTTAKKTGSYIVHASEWGQRGGGIWQKGVVDTVNAVPRVIGNATVDALVWGGKKMVKDTTPNIGNLWTGKKESKFGIAVAATAVAGYSGWQGMKQTTLAPKLGQVSYSGTAPIMDADGVSSTPQAPLTNAPTLGASGQMVFGLHNARKG